MSRLISCLSHCTIGALLLLSAAAAHAEVRGDGFYGGLKVAYFKPELTDEDRETFDGPDNVGFLLGYEKRLKNGALPLSVLEAQIDGWIAEQQAGSGN